MKRSFSKDYWLALQVSLVFQIVIGFLTAIALDGGMSFRLWSLAMAAYWGGLLLVLFKRPKTPTKFDLFLVRWGFPPLLVLVPLLSGLIWRLRGL